MELRYVFILIAMIAIGIIAIPSTYSTFASEHSFSDTGNCLQCHSDIRSELDSSTIHANLTCETCHIDPSLNNSGPHGNVIIPRCITCHGNVVQSLNNDSHISFMLAASSLPQDENKACIACHSSISNDITFTKPSYFEWDVSNSASGSWLIENLDIGANKDIRINYGDNSGNVHHISLDNGCINCHGDIKNAVISGGHSNEQWTKKHDYTTYSDMNLYCESCHRPSTQNIAGVIPYPTLPFNLAIHDSMTVSCIDCHTKSDLLANINGGMKLATYDSNIMGNIEASIAEQPYNVQSYLCIACKNTGNPSPVNGSLHFKMLTEPDITIYLNITTIPTPTITPTSTPGGNQAVQETVTATSTPTITPNSTPGGNQAVQETVTATSTPTIMPNSTPGGNQAIQETVTATSTPTIMPTSTPGGNQASQ